jgi:hypothetical protein
VGLVMVVSSEGTDSGAGVVTCKELHPTNGFSGFDYNGLRLGPFGGGSDRKAPAFAGGYLLFFTYLSLRLCGSLGHSSQKMVLGTSLIEFKH